MDKEAVKDLLYGGIMELMRKRNNYYCSSVGSAYNHFTETGKEALFAYVTQMATLMQIAEEENIEERAKNMVLKGLKGEQS